MGIFSHSTETETKPEPLYPPNRRLIWGSDFAGALNQDFGKGTLLTEAQAREHLHKKYIYWEIQPFDNFWPDKTEIRSIPITRRKFVPVNK